MPAVHGKAGALVATESAGMVQPVGHRHTGDEGASPTPADGSAAPSLPTGWDEKEALETVEKESKRLGRLARERHSRGAVSW